MGESTILYTVLVATYYPNRTYLAYTIIHNHSQKITILTFQSTLTGHYDLID